MNDPIVDESAASVPRPRRNGNDLRRIFENARRREEESHHRLIAKNTAR